MKLYRCWFIFWLLIDEVHSCSIEDSCRQSSSNFTPSINTNEHLIQSRNCFCDDLCDEFGDCCATISTKTRNFYRCIDYLEPIITPRMMPFHRLSLWMRSECLSIYVGSSIDHQCRNLAKENFNGNPWLFLPVTSLETNITYRNYFCAFCNNDIRGRIQLWEYKIYCYREMIVIPPNEKFNEQMQNLTKDCVRTIDYPQIPDANEPLPFIRPCKKLIASNCPANSSRDLARNCSMGGNAYRYVIQSDLIYKNSFCAQCHERNLTELTCYDPIRPSAIPPMLNARIYPLSILFDPSLFINFAPKFVYSSNKKCGKSNGLFNVMTKTCSNLTQSKDDLILSMDNCSHPMITAEETRHYPNGSIYLRDQSIVLRKDQFVSINSNEILFCVDEFFYQRPAFPMYRHMISMICLCISLGCLVMFIITYWLNLSLKNLPGRCLFCLSMSIFLGQFLFIFASILHLGSFYCLLSAIFIHFLYLSSFFWLLMIAIQVSRTFTSDGLPRERNHRDQFRLVIYNLIVWCSSGVIVTIAFLIQLIRPQSKYSPAYGLLFCSISKSKAMIFFLLVPIGISLSIVFVLFIRTILAIHRSHSVAKTATVSSTSSLTNVNLIFVYIRLGSLMGLQWILLLIALIIRRSWSWTLFEIINSLPGVFICFGFLFSCRLWKNFKEQLTSRCVDRRPPPTTTTSSTLLNSSLPLLRQRPNLLV